MPVLRPSARFRPLAVAFLLLFGAFPALAAPRAPSPATPAARVAKLFAPWDRKDSPGCAVAVVKDGRIVYERGFGSANLDYDVPITPRTVFHVASVSKQFTAFAIQLLAKDGKLSLDDDVRKYIPELHDFGKTITIRHLLHHTSGLRDQWDLAQMAGWRMDDIITQDDLLRLICRQKELNFDPGEEHLYCNSGYTLLATIVERVSGKPFTEFTRTRIFQPLGMARTHFHRDYQEVVPDRAYSYEPGDKGHFRYDVLSFGNVGATSLYTTVEDLVKWDRNFYDAKVGGPAVIAAMLEKGKLNSGKEIDYACGLIHGTYRGLKTVWHNGGDAGYRSQIVRFPDQRFTVIVLANLGSLDATGIAYKVADIFLGKALKGTPDAAPKPATTLKAVTVDPKTLDACAGDYELFAGFVLTFTHRDGRFWLRATGQPEVEAFPASDTDYFLKVVDARMTFKRSGNGAATEVVLHQNGHDVTGKRVTLAAPPAEALAAYAGTYYSDELGALYTVSAKDGKLIMADRTGDTALEPGKTDQFLARGARIQFIRDGAGTVARLTMSTDRARNVAFVKVDVRPVVPGA